MQKRLLSTALLFLALPTLAAFGREWQSANGHYQLKADLISFNDELAVLKKSDGAMVAVELKELSEDDRKYLESKESKTSQKKSADEMQTWTGVDGMKVRGRVIAFGRKELTIVRKSGKVYVNDKLFSELDELHQRLIMKILTKLENTTIDDEEKLIAWAKKQRGAPKTYTLEGVMMALESGDEIGAPFFLFSKSDLEILRPGWQRWLESEKDPSSRAEESFLVRSAAMAYQQDRAAKKQIEMLKLNLLGAATGVVDIWEVGLRPGPRTYGRPTSVLVSAQNSNQATQIALRQHPGYVLYGVRKASN